MYFSALIRLFLLLLPTANAFTSHKVSLMRVAGFSRPAQASSDHGETSSSKEPPPHVVIVGGGIGGLSSAYDARHVLPHDTRITVVSERPTFDFTPSNPWVAMGKRQPADIQVDLVPTLPKYRIDFLLGRATKLLPEKNQLRLSTGDTLHYDYLIVATGAQLAFDVAPGLRQYGVSVCTTPHAQHALTALEQLVQDPGPVVVGATQGASCFGPAYEYALTLQHELRQRGGPDLVDACPIHFVTPEPVIGHLGLGGAGNSQQLLAQLFRQHHVQAYPNTKTLKVTPTSVVIESLDTETGQSLGTQALPSKLTMLIPPFHGHDVWKQVPGLTNKNGLITINQHEQSIRYPNVFGVGVCVELPPPAGTYHVPLGSPKTGYMIEAQGTAAVKNIQRLLQWNKRHPSDVEKDQGDLHTAPTLNGVCITDFGDSGAVFLTLPQFPPRRLDATIHNSAVVAAKVAFEKYFLHKVASGNTDPVYEKYMLKLLGVERTKQD